MFVLYDLNFGIRIQPSLFEVETKQSPKRAKNVIIDSKYFEITKKQGYIDQ